MMAVGADRMVAALSRPSLLIVNYHRLHASADRPRSRFDDGVFGPDVETFRRQVEWLKAATTILDEKGVLSVLSGNDLPRGSLLSAITFDDGYIDCYTLARPVLEELDVRGLFFLPVEMLESRRLGWWDIAAYLLKKTRHEQLSLNDQTFDLSNDFRGSLKRVLALFKLEKAERTVGLLEQLSRACEVALPGKDEQSAELLSWKQVREMKSAGHGVGSHSLSHRVLSTLERAAQAHEIRESKRELEAIIGSKISSFAYPVGGRAHYNADSVELTRQAGYSCAFTFNTGIAKIPVADPFQIPRESANSLEELKAKMCLPGVMGLHDG